MRRLILKVFSLGLVAAAGCGGSSSGTAPNDSVTEVATSVVGGALNNVGGASLGWNMVPAPKRSTLRHVLDDLSPIGKAYAADWTCTGGSLSPAFDGSASNPYTLTPLSCSVTWDNGKTGSSEWTGTFQLEYGTSCDTKHAYVGNQVENCSVTRTTPNPPGPATRTITGPDGNQYAITHDTNGAGTGWDTTALPVPNDGGVVVTCVGGTCASTGGTLVINGSHLTGTVTPSGGAPTKIWDHTISSAGLNFTGSATTRLVNGNMTVQHNLAQYTATVTFDNVGYGQPLTCCFPTTGSVTATVLDGSLKGRTETLTFSANCGDATITTTSGKTYPMTLKHCL